MENKSIDNQISNLMQERRQGFNDYTKKMIDNKNYLKNFDEKYYLRNDKKMTIPNTYSASGKMNDDLSSTFETIPGEQKKSLKEKALELESLIVDSLVRENFDEAKMLFGTLKKMNNRNRDDNVKDIFLRVQDAMPKRAPKKNTYSYQNNKNNFQEVLNAMSNLDNVSAFNDNQCMSKLGEMWDTCDRNICSDKCKDRIMEAYKQSKDEECGDVITSTKDGKDVTMGDDIKNIILERLRYCKRIQDLDKQDHESINYSDVEDLKNKTIEDIHKTVKLANLHYHNCQDKAENYIAKDDKLSKIVNMVAELDLSKLNLEKLQELRSNLNLLPSCDKIRYDTFQEEREENVKGGIRVGKYVIPQDSDYYRQLQSAGKENPTIYKDLVSGKDYFYDAFSKTLTGIKYPETRDMEQITESPVEAPSLPPANTNLQDIDVEKLLGLDEMEKVPADSPSLSMEPGISNPSESIIVNSTPSETVNNVVENNVIENNLVLENNNRNILNLKNVDESAPENSIIFGLDLNSLLGYILILVVVLVIFYVVVGMIRNQ